MNLSLKGKNILVTGGAGFIGSWIVDEVALHDPEAVLVVDNFFLGKMENLNSATKRLGEKLKVYECDATENKTLRDVFVRESPIDVVFNLAVKPLSVSFVDPKSTFLTAVDVAVNLLEFQREELFKTLIHVSSSEAYGSAQYVPMDEQHPLVPTTPYGAGKAAADHLVLSYFETYGNDVAVIRPFNNFGPRQNEKAYAGIVPTSIKRIMRGNAPTIFGDGNQTRDFMYVKDTVEAAVKIYETKETRGKIINIGRGKETCINELVQRIVKIMGFNGEIVYDNPRTADVRRHLADVTLAKKLINFSPKISLEDGLQKTIAWYINKRDHK